MSISTQGSIKGYELLELIGEGAYGAVYRARQEFIDREVAVKIILPEYANQPDFIRRFDTEAQLVAQLEHLHIVPLYDYWRDPEGAYLVMRLMKGGSLEDSLREGGPWNPEDTARLVDQVASALDAAHQQGVVHRDLKPANILLDEDGNAYLSDFGIAKELGASAEATQTGAILGTPAYITPEQVQSQPVTPQTDIYALGVMLYELLVGGHPFPDTSTAELVVKHLQEPLPYVRDTHPDLPAALDGVIQRATAKNPADRYPSASALAEDYRRALQLEALLPEIPEEEMYNPYKGLRAFQEADCDDFFGREALTGQLLAQLAQPSEGNRFLAVVGPSGSGKSSVVKAGLVPALRKGALPGSDQWFIVETHPGAHPLQELELGLLSISADPGANLGELLTEDENGLLKAARSTLPSEESELLLVIDQFEELFILVEDEEERNFFLESLHTAVSETEGRVRVVITLRADFYDRPLLHPAFGKLVEERTAVVLPLSPEELEQAIRRPAERVGAVLEKGLVTAITTDVAEQPGALPLLQYALTELFERREGRMLTNQAYQAIGGVLGALGRRAEEVYDELDQGGKDAARQLFMRLVTLGEGAEDTRRRVLRPELESLFSGQPSVIITVIDVFGKARLLSFDRDPVTRGPTVEVAHEALLQEWRRLREWLDESRADIRMQRVLSNATNEWLASNQESSFLLRGSRLDQFEAWAATTDLAFTQAEGDYLDSSLAGRRVRQAAEAERMVREAAMERRSRNFLRALVGVFAIATVVALVLTIYALNARNQAKQQGQIAQSEANQRATAEVIALEEREEALNQADARATQQAIAEAEAEARTVAEEQAVEERDRAVIAEQDALVQVSIGLASQSKLELEGAAPERSVLLALEAMEDYPYTWQAERALGQAVLNSQLKLILNHDGKVNTAQWSADGTKILTGGVDETVRVWDTLTGDELLRITEGNPTVASWSPNEESILALNDIDSTLVVWDIEIGSIRFTLNIDDIGGESFLRFDDWIPWSPSGDRFLTYDENGTVKIWDAESGGALLTLSSDHSGKYGDARWSPSGDLILSASPQDNMIFLWQSKTGDLLYTITGDFETEEIYLGDWSPTGDRFTIVGDGGAKVYDTATGRQLLYLPTPGFVYRVKWSPDGLRILTTVTEGGSGFATLWNAESGQELSNIPDLNMAFGSDWSTSGKLAAIGTGGFSVHVWDINKDQEVHKLVGAPPFIWHVAFSPGGERILATGEDNTVKIYDLTSTLLTIPVPPGWAGGYWSRDGEQIAYAFTDGTVKIWNSVSGDEELLLSGHETPVYWLVWSPSGDRILTAGFDETARIWDANSGEQLLIFTGHQDRVYDAAWSPDGTRISSSDQHDGNVYVWDSETGEILLTFTEHQGSINQTIWSPDGERILSLGDGGEACIWDPTTGEILLDLYEEDFTQNVVTGVWSKDGQQVYIHSADSFVRVFDTETGEQLQEFPTPNAIGGLSLSPTEGRFLIGNSDGSAKVYDASTGAEMISYDDQGFVLASYSPDGSRVLCGTTGGTLKVYPTWHSPQELIDYAKECCLIRQLTQEERELFGLPPRE